MGRLLLVQEIVPVLLRPFVHRDNRQQGLGPNFCVEAIGSRGVEDYLAKNDTCFTNRRQIAFVQWRKLLDLANEDILVLVETAKLLVQDKQNPRKALTASGVVFN